MKEYYCVECGCSLLELGKANDIHYYTCQICGHDYSFEYKEDGIIAIEIVKEIK